MGLDKFVDFSLNIGGLRKSDKFNFILATKKLADLGNLHTSMRATASRC